MVYPYQIAALTVFLFLMPVVFSSECSSPTPSLCLTSEGLSCQSCSQGCALFLNACISCASLHCESCTSVHTCPASSSPPAPSPIDPTSPEDTSTCSSCAYFDACAACGLIHPSNPTPRLLRSRAHRTSSNNSNSSPIYIAVPIGVVVILIM